MRARLKDEMARITIGDAIVTMRDKTLMDQMAQTLERRLLNGQISETEAYRFCMCFATVVSMAGGTWGRDCARRRQP